MQIQLEVGKFYLTRCGVIVKIIYCDNKGELPFYGEIQNAKHETATIFYTPNGNANPYSRQSDPCNIVKEIEAD